MRGLGEWRGKDSENEGFSLTHTALGEMLREREERVEVVGEDFKEARE